MKAKLIRRRNTQPVRTKLRKARTAVRVVQIRPGVVIFLPR